MLLREERGRGSGPLTFLCMTCEAPPYIDTDEHTVVLQGSVQSLDLAWYYYLRSE